MKTNQIMKVAIGTGEILVGHKDMMGDLSRVFDVGNTYRCQAGQKSLRMEAWVKMASTMDYIKLVSDDIGRPAKVARRGNLGGTWVHLRILIDAAMYLSPILKDEVIKTFLAQRLLSIRDESGDNFLDLNAAVAVAAEEVFGKPAHTGHYIQLAKLIKERLDVADWNAASADLLNERARLEETITRMLRAGVVRDWDHLKELAEFV
jgi:hypothetical protein